MPPMPNKSLSSLFIQMTGWLLPAQCWLCRAAHRHTQFVCAKCIATLPRNVEACSHCAAPISTSLNAPPQGSRRNCLPRYCASCLKQSPHIERTVAPFLMRDSFRELLHAWKFNNRPQLSPFLAGLFRDATTNEMGIHVTTDTKPLLIPVPTQWHRQIWRGFDHTWLLAQALKHAIRPDAEIQPWLSNTRARQSHHRLSRAARWANSEGRFVGDPRVQGRDIVLIDDVMTTGATVSSAALACHLAGAKSVCVWCLARTPAPSSAG